MADGKAGAEHDYVRGEEDARGGFLSGIVSRVEPSKAAYPSSQPAVE